MKLFLTSSLDTNYKDENNNKIPIHFGNKNRILENFKKHIKKYDNFLYVASDEFNTEITDIYAKATIDSFKITLPFKNYNVLDIRSEDKIDELINNADFIFLCGGHVPTQMDFFKNIRLKEKIKRSNAVICGSSAGSMNCAIKVYCPPELEGESMDPNFKKIVDGLALTNINILPHFNDLNECILDNKKYIEEIILPDSYKLKIYALNDGSYFFIDDSTITLYGESYEISNGDIIKINDDDKMLIINK